MQKLNKEKGLTFVIVTHDPGVGKKCGRIIEMRNGLIVGETRN
jgi:predicted ABC-type transport system involved in lysophospholipase L1 biosynthesis ATPase subunit